MITSADTADSYLIAIFSNLLVARARANLTRRCALPAAVDRAHAGLRFHWQTAFDLVGGRPRLTTDVRREAAARARERLADDRRLRQCRCSICKETIRARTL